MKPHFVTDSTCGFKLLEDLPPDPPFCGAPLLFQSRSAPAEGPLSLKPCGLCQSDVYIIALMR